MALCLLRNGDEEAYEEQYDGEQDEDDGVLESSPEAASGRLAALVARNFVVLFVPEVGEGHDEQAEHGIQTVQGVVDNLELEQDVVDGVRGGPVFLSPTLAVASGRDQSDVDGHQEYGCQQREDGDDADNRHGGIAFTWSLVDIDKDGGDEKEDGDGDSIRDPYQGRLYKRHDKRSLGRSRQGRVRWSGRSRL